MNHLHRGVMSSLRTHLHGDSICTPPPLTENLTNFTFASDNDKTALSANQILDPGLRAYQQAYLHMYDT